MGANRSAAVGGGEVCRSWLVATGVAWMAMMVLGGAAGWRAAEVRLAAEEEVARVSVGGAQAGPRRAARPAPIRAAPPRTDPR